MQQIANDNHQHFIDGNITQLHQEVIFNNIDVIIKMLHRGINVDVKSVYGKTPLHFAAQLGYLDIVGILVDNGANILSHDQFGWSASHRAADNGHTQIIKYLIRENIKIINMQTRIGLTMLHIAAHKGQLEMVKLLLEYGIDKNLIMSKGLNAAQIAHNAGFYNISQIIKQ